MKYQQFQQIIKTLKDSYPTDDTQSFSKYFKFHHERHRPIFTKQAPIFLIQHFHKLEKQKQPKTSITSTNSFRYKDLPLELRIQVSTYEELKMYKRVKKTGIQWAIIVYAYYLSLRLPTSIHFEITFLNFSVQVVKKQFSASKDHRSEIQLAIYTPDGYEPIVSNSYILENPWSYDENDIQLLSDLSFLFTMYPILIEPYIHDEFQDLLVHLRHQEPDILLAIINFHIDWEKLKRTPVSENVKQLLFHRFQYTFGHGSHLLKQITLRHLLPDRDVRLNQVVQYKQYWPTQRWVKGKIVQRINPLEFLVSPLQNDKEKRHFYRQDLRFVEPLQGQKQRTMNFFQFLYKFPLRYSRVEQKDIVHDQDD